MKYQKIFYRIDNTGRKKIFCFRNSTSKCYPQNYSQRLLNPVNNNNKFIDLSKKYKMCGYSNDINKIIHIQKTKNDLFRLSFSTFSTNSQCLVLLLILLFIY